MADKLNFPRSTPPTTQGVIGKREDNSTQPARRNADGSVTLYEKQGHARPHSPFAASSGVSAQRGPLHDLVRARVDTVDPTGRSASALIQNMRRPLDLGTRATLKDASHKRLAEIGQSVNSREFGPSLTECAPFLDHLPGYIDDIERDIGNPTLIDAHAQQMGDAIAKAYLARHPEGGEELALSAGIGIKRELGEALIAQLDLSRLPEDFLDNVFNRAASQVLVNQLVPGSDHLIINGKTYRPDHKLSETAHSTAWLYVSDDGSSIAFKLAKAGKDMKPEEIQKANSDLANEIRSYRLLIEQGDSSRPKLEGAIRTPGGSIGFALEGLPSGNLSVGLTQLADHVKAGNVSARAARAVAMTLVKDTLESLRHMRALGSPVALTQSNVGIDVNGYAKVADFGGLAPEDTRWRAPEDAVQGAAVDAGAVLRSAELVQMGASVRARFGNLDDAAFAQLVGDIRADSDRAANLSVPGPKSDAWALGAMAFSLVFGRELDASRPVGAGEGDAQRFARNASNVALDTSRPDAGVPWLESAGPGRIGLSDSEPSIPGDASRMSYAGSSGSPEIDSLLNQLLAPLPEQRPELGHLLDHPAFSVTGAGAVRELIREAFASEPDPARIQQLSNRIDGLA